MLGHSLKILVIAIGSVLFALYLFGGNLNAKWGIIDDHGIMHFMGPDGKVEINEIPGLLLNTEVGSPGTSVRYRPSYYLIRIVETFLWGNSPQLWYLFRLILFATSSAILWWIVDRNIGLIPGMFFVLYVASFSFWSDVWNRLGPAETYAVFGTAIYCLGYIGALRPSEPSSSSLINRGMISWNLMLWGAVISMGSKENFLLLLIPSFALLVILWKRGVLTKIAIISSLVLFGYGGFIVTAVAVALSKTTRDIYLNSVEPTGRLALVSQGLDKVFADHYLLFIVSAVLMSISIMILYLTRQNTDEKTAIIRISAKKFMVISFTLLLIYISQYVFYDGKWPNGTRYDFPGVLTGPFLVFSVIVFLLDMSSAFKSSKMVKNTLLTLFSLILILFISHESYAKLRSASQRNAVRTSLFSDRISKVAEVLNNDPDAGVVFDVYFADMDYEPVVSVSKFLRTYRVKNPFYVSIDRLRYSNSSLGKELAERFSNLSVRGNDDFEPIGELIEKHNKCYSISFSGPGFGGCDHFGRIW